MRKAALIMLMAVLVCTQGLAQKSSQGSSQKKAKLEREIAILDQQLKENAGKVRSANTALKLTRKKISSRKSLVKESEAQISMLDRRIREKDHKIDSLERRYDLLSANYEKLVRTAYRNRDTRIWYMYLLSSEGLTQGLRRFGYLKSMAGGLNAQALEIKDTRAKLEEEKAGLQKLREEASVLRSAHVGELKKLEADESQSQQLVASLNKDKARYQKELAAKKKQVEALKAEMNKMVKKSTSKPKTAVDEKLDKEFASNMGKLRWGADGRVVD